MSTPKPPFHRLLPTELCLMIYGFLFDATPHPNTVIDLAHARPPPYALLASCSDIYFEARQTYRDSYKRYWRQGNFRIQVDLSDEDSMQPARAAVLRSPCEVNSIRNLTFTYRLDETFDFESLAYIDMRGLMCSPGAPPGSSSHHVIAPEWGPGPLTRSGIYFRCSQARFDLLHFTNLTSASAHLASLDHTALLDDQLLWALGEDYPNTTHTDNYLSLCLEEAAKSPLHYRHGAIIVRGGKVIGRGHNDYRPGFNGGALKTGRIANGTYDGAAVTELKKKLKGKQKCKQDHQQQRQESHGTFVPFESTNSGGGHSVNQPLSMHSEMMAIYSALNASSTLSSTTFSREKPCFKLPRADTRKARLRRAVLEAYAKAVCDTSASTGKLQVRLENKSNNKVLEYNNDNHNVATQTLADLSLAFHKDVGTRKHHQYRKNEKKNGKKNRYEYQYDRYGQAQRDHGQQRQARFASKAGQPSSSRTDDRDVLRDHDSTSTDDDDGSTTFAKSVKNSHRTSAGKSCKQISTAAVNASTRPIACNVQSAKIRSDAASQTTPESTQPVLMPTARAIKSNDRKQHSRLQGADLYVVRIGHTGTPQIKPPKSKAVPALAPSPLCTSGDNADDALSSSIDSLSSLSITSSRSGTGSLHDELVNPEPSPSPSHAGSAKHDCSFDRDKIHASRPCYRCVAFMHKVGIRRVFWTNDAGVWEGGKVSALIDAMDNGMEDGANGGPTGNGVFVTKHEVLMLRRMMGAKANKPSTKERGPQS
ncbi:hypothetical protein BST61_g1837 [Cercospora zeina]